MKCIVFNSSNNDDGDKNIRCSSNFNYICDISNVYDYDDDKQLSMIENLYKVIDFENRVSLVKDIKIKLTSYSQQDKLKKIFKPEEFVTFKEVINLLYDTRMQCYYCKKRVKVIYKYKRAPQQWTLDRIDNTKGHIKNNLVISCLQCNLGRRCLNSDKYLFTKTLNIVKI